MIPFDANTTAKTASAFEWAWQPPKIDNSRGGISTLVFLGPMRLSYQTASRSAQLFLQGWWKWSTDWLTHYFIC